MKYWVMTRARVLFFSAILGIVGSMLGAPGCRICTENVPDMLLWCGLFFFVGYLVLGLTTIFADTVERNRSTHHPSKAELDSRY